MPYSSNLNARLYVAGCKALKNPRVSWTCVEPMIAGNASAYWDWQMNCYSAPGSAGLAGFQQFIANVGNGQVYLSIAFIKANDFFLGEFYYPLPKQFLPSGATTFPVGWRVDMTVLTDPATNVTQGAKLDVYDATGALWDTVTATTGWDHSWDAPITVFSWEALGALGTPSNFSSGRGRIVYHPNAAGPWSVFSPVPPHWAPAACVIRDTQHTGEPDPKMLYSDATIQSDGSATQDNGTSLGPLTPTTVSVSARAH